MKVFVVMSNDFPDSVFADKENAEAFVACMKVVEKKRVPRSGPRIYWRYYEFELETMARGT